MNRYLAHISEDGTREQSVLDHLQGTARLAAQFASAFDAEQLGRLSGMAHDIGKYSDAFQRRLHGGAARVDHATAGAFECEKQGQRLAGYAVAGHHGGLPDFGGQTDPADAPTYAGRVKRAAQGSLPDYAAFAREVRLPAASLPASLRTQPLDLAFFIRMLYACLVDADFLDTEAFMKNRERETCSVSMDALVARLDAHCAGWFPPRTPLNEKRCAILRRCEAAGPAQQPDLFTLTVPTGGGKTIASLAFALRHARAHGMRRVIYVIPYTSIIEQNADVFRRILGEDCVLEHHANVLYDAQDESTPDTVRKAQAVENWDSPVVVTTAVQFFESLFACRPSKCRKLHNIANSVVIFDEAQMLPLPLLRPCVYAIAQLVRAYRVSAVLCTATQPALGPLFREFLPDMSARELCPDADFAAFRRATYRHAGRLSLDALAERLCAHPQALCIVNSRQAAKDLFDRLPPQSAYHLSTLMMPAHRQAVLETIRARLREGLPCRVVSTSLIEAGVDVDFPVVYREEAGLDSILQAGGRCNREGKRPAEEAIVTVFRSDTPAPKLFGKAIEAGRRVLNRYAAPDDPQAVACYFHELLNLNGAQAQDAKRILDKVRTLSFRAVAEDFRMIEENTRTVYIPTPDSEPLLAQLRAGERSRRLFRQLGRYGVSIYERHFQALCDAHDIELLDEGCAVLINPALYTMQTGLSLEADSGKAEFI